MNTYGKKKIVSLLLFIVGIVASSTSLAWHGGGLGFGFGGGGFGFQGNYWNAYPYGGGGYFYGGGPNIIIDVPVVRPYVQRCQEVEVCDPYDQCWLERTCY